MGGGWQPRWSLVTRPELPIYGGEVTCPPTCEHPLAAAMQRPKPLVYTRVSKRVITIEPGAVSLTDVHPAPPGGSCFAGAAPPRASPPLATTVLLSPLDTCVFVKNLSPTCAFWYARCPDAALMVEALRRTLRVFPIVAGRLRKAPQPNALDAEYEVLCNDAGVTFDIFSCSGTVADFMGPGGGVHHQPRGNLKPAPFNAAVDTVAAARGTGPLARFRLTRLADGGGILGLSFSHIIVDGHSGLHFNYVWSHEYEALAGNPLPGPRLPFGEPEFDRTSFRDAITAPAELPEEVRAQTQALLEAGKKMGASISRGMLLGRLSKLACDLLVRKQQTFAVPISAAQVKAAREAGSLLTGEPLSANDVCVGIAWSALRAVRARGPAAPPRLASAEGNFASQTIDLRRYLAVSDAYFGNTAWFVQMVAPCAARTAADYAAACRTSLTGFASSGLVFEQAEMLAKASVSGPDGDALKTFMLPMFGDGMISSWYAPHMWKFSFGGPPLHFNGGIFPASPWGFCVSAGAEGGYVLHGTCPASKLKPLVAALKQAIEEVSGAA